MDEARREVRDLKSIFGDRLYLEIQSNALKEQLPVNHGICALASEEGLPLVATADSHYVKREDAKAHEVLMAIASAARSTIRSACATTPRSCTSSRHRKCTGRWRPSPASARSGRRRCTTPGSSPSSATST